MWENIAIFLVMVALVFHAVRVIRKLSRRRMDRTWDELDAIDRQMRISQARAFITQISDPELVREYLALFEEIEREG